MVGAFRAALFSVCGLLAMACGDVAVDGADSGCFEAGRPFPVISIAADDACAPHRLSVLAVDRAACGPEGLSGSLARMTTPEGAALLTVNGAGPSSQEYCVAVLGRGVCDELVCGSLVCGSISERTSLDIELDTSATDDEAFVVLGAGEVVVRVCAP